MSNFVAVIKGLVGQVFVVSLDGLKRQVFEGERLFQGDQVVTASGGSATLQLANGDVIDIAANGNWQAAAWLLERRWRDEYSGKVLGVDSGGAPVQIMLQMERPKKK